MYKYKNRFQTINSKKSCLYDKTRLRQQFSQFPHFCIFFFFHLRIISKPWNQYNKQPDSKTQSLDTQLYRTVSKNSNSQILKQFETNKRTTTISSKILDSHFYPLLAPRIFQSSVSRHPIPKFHCFRFPNLKLIRRYKKGGRGRGRGERDENRLERRTIGKNQRHSTPRDTATNGTGGRASGYRLPSSIQRGCIEIAKQMEPTERKKEWRRASTKLSVTGLSSWWLSSFRVARVVWGEGEGGRGGGSHAEAEGSWNQVSRGNGLIGGVPRMIFDLRRRGGWSTPPVPRPIPRPIIFLKAAGGRARLAEIRTARQIET